MGTNFCTMILMEFEMLSLFDFIDEENNNEISKTIGQAVVETIKVTEKKQHKEDYENKKRLQKNLADANTFAEKKKALKEITVKKTYRKRKKKEDNEEDEISDSEANNALVGLSSFFQQVNEYKLLTREEEQELFSAYQQSEDPELKKEIRNQIICCNIKLVISVAKKISKISSKNTFSDMINDGILGLIRAIEKFEPERGLKFSTYAFPWINQTISRSIANTGDTIRIPVHFTENLSKIRRYETKQMAIRGEDSIPDEEISEALNIPLAKVQRYKKAAAPISSLDIAIDEKDTSIVDLIEDTTSGDMNDTLINNDLRKELLKAIRTLDERESFIIMNQYQLGDGIPLSIHDLAKKFNISKERVHQIETTALQKLRHPSRSSKFIEYY